MVYDLGNLLHFWVAAAALKTEGSCEGNLCDYVLPTNQWYLSAEVAVVTIMQAATVQSALLCVGASLF